MSLHHLQLLVLLGHLLLLGLYRLALCLLIGRILTYERQAAIHLRKVLGAEDKHELVLHRVMTGHIAHRTDILVLSVLQLLFKGFELSIEQADIAIDVVDILLYTIDVLLSLVDFAIKHHEVLQTFLHVGLIAAESSLLLLDFLLYVGTLSLQSSNGSIAIGGFLLCPCGSLGLAPFHRLLFWGFLLGSYRSCRCGSLLSLCSLLRIRSQDKRQGQNNQ